MGVGGFLGFARCGIDHRNGFEAEKLLDKFFHYFDFKIVLVKIPGFTLCRTGDKLINHECWD